MTVTAMTWPLEGEHRREKIRNGTRRTWICGQNVSQASDQKQDAPCVARLATQRQAAVKRIPFFVDPSKMLIQQPYLEEGIILHHERAPSHLLAPATSSTIAYAGERPAASFIGACDVGVTTRSPDVPHPLLEIVTPLKHLRFQLHLRDHPDLNFVSYVLNGIRLGFRIGYLHQQNTGIVIANHLSTALEKPQVIDNHLEKEIGLGRMAGPFSTPPYDRMQASGLGVVPKKDGGSRIIYHLSAPAGSSVNDGIDPACWSLQYCSVDDALAEVRRLGKDCWMGKIDLKDAFRMCPVNPADHHLLSIYWQGKFYVDKCLPFGLRSAPGIFNSIAEAIQWIAKEKFNVSYLIHYLDDFFTASSTATACGENLEQTIGVCDDLGAPVKPEKVEGPVKEIAFLGIHIDSNNMTVSLPHEKKEELRNKIEEFVNKKKATKRELLSLIGKLSFACKVLPAGRIFLRRMIDLSTTVKELHYHIYLSQDFTKDLQWWRQILPGWSGSTFILEPEWSTPKSFHFYTDASGGISYRAYWNGHWFNGTWKEGQERKDIQWKELLVIVMAAATWGHCWTGKRIMAHCDNQAVCDIWRKGSSRNRDLMDLVRSLYHIAASYNFNIIVVHIPGVTALPTLYPAYRWRGSGV